MRNTCPHFLQRTRRPTSSAPTVVRCPQPSQAATIWPGATELAASHGGARSAAPGFGRGVKAAGALLAGRFAGSLGRGSRGTGRSTRFLGRGVWRRSFVVQLGQAQLVRLGHRQGRAAVAASKALAGVTIADAKVRSAGLAGYRNRHRGPSNKSHHVYLLLARVPKTAGAEVSAPDPDVGSNRAALRVVGLAQENCDPTYCRNVAIPSGRPARGNRRTTLRLHQGLSPGAPRRPPSEPPRRGLVPEVDPIGFFAPSTFAVTPFAALGRSTRPIAARSRQTAATRRVRSSRRSRPP